jgi:hypothetical protein
LSAGTGFASGVFCGFGAGGGDGSCPQHTALSAADRIAIAEKRMVEVLHANGIYSSPIVITIMIKAYDEKGPSVLKVENKFLPRH